MRPKRYGSAVPQQGSAMSAPVSGLGKLLPGTHSVEVISLCRTATNEWSVILQTSRQECHSEVLKHWPPEWPLGYHLQAEVGLGPGFVLYTSPDGFQGRDSKTRAPLTDWLPSAREVFVALRPLDPAVPELWRVYDPVTDKSLYTTSHPDSVSEDSDHGAAGPQTLD